MAITAKGYFRKMRGGSQSHLMLGSDGFAYVVKFLNNGQNPQVLPAELLATKLAELLKLPVPHCEVVYVSSQLINETAELIVAGASGVMERCRAGSQFGSRLVGGTMPGQLVEYLPGEQLEKVRNLAEFTGMLVFDKWTCNTDGRQAVFHERRRGGGYKATFIDQGHCFGGGDWSGMKDAPLRGVYARNSVYAGVTGWASFEPWLGSLQMLDGQAVWNSAQSVPPEWYGGRQTVLEALIEKLMRRRTLVPELIQLFRASSRNPFPKWQVRPQ